MTRRKVNLFLTLTLILCLFAGSDVRADLGFMAGDGNNVAYGRSFLLVNLPIDEKGTENDVECLLVGIIKGIPVVVPIGQTPATADRLFMVEIIDSSHARFSGSVANIVSVKFLGGKTLAQVMTEMGDGAPYFQVLERARTYSEDFELLLVNGTHHIYVFTLNMIEDHATGLKTLLANQWDKQTYSDMRIINIDPIDLNDYLKNPTDKVPLRASLAIWYQRENKFWGNRNFRTQANSLALGHYQINNIDIYQKLENVGVFDDMRQGPDMWKKEKAKTRAVAGGAFVNPDANGAVHYWFGYTELDYWFLVNGSAVMNQHLKTASVEIYYDEGANRLMFKNPESVHNSFTWYYKTKDLGRMDGEINRYMRYGAWLKLRKDDAGAVYIDGACNPRRDDGPWWEYDSLSIGTLEQHEGVEWSDVKGISEYDDNKSELTEMQRKERVLVNQGVQVSTVVYGWPYFGVKGTPGSSNTPSFARKQSSQIISWKKESYGVGFNSELGGGWGIKGVYKSSLSEISGFSWGKGSQTTDIEALTVKISESYSNMKFEEFAKEGLVIYNTVKPILLAYGTFLPKNTSSLHVDGVNAAYYGEFTFPVTTVGVSPDIGLQYDRFDMTNPKKSLYGDASPLSAGLAPRKINTLRPGQQDLFEDVNDILAWQKANQVEDFVALAGQNKAGLKRVARSEYKPDMNITMDYSREHSQASTKHWDWYAGAHYKTSPDLVGVLAEATVKHTGSIDTSDTESQTKGYTLEFKGIPDIGFASVNFATYFIEVDIGKLKNWIIQNKDDSGIPFKGKPALIPDWNWKYQQNFTLVITKYEGKRLEDKIATSRVFTLEDNSKVRLTLNAFYNAEGSAMKLQLRQEPLLVETPPNLHLPFGLVSMLVKKGHGGVGAKFTLGIPGNAPVNGLWVKTASDEWMNIAKKVLWNGERTTVTFYAEDGVLNDEDDAVNSQIVLHAAPGFMMWSDLPE